MLAIPDFQSGEFVLLGSSFTCPPILVPLKKIMDEPCPFKGESVNLSTIRTGKSMDDAGNKPCAHTDVSGSLFPLPRGCHERQRHFYGYASNRTMPYYGVGLPSFEAILSPDGTWFGSDTLPKHQYGGIFDCSCTEELRLTHQSRGIVLLKYKYEYSYFKTSKKDPKDRCSGTNEFEVLYHLSDNTVSTSGWHEETRTFWDYSRDDWRTVTIPGEIRGDWALSRLVYNLEFNIKTGAQAFAINDVDRKQCYMSINRNEKAEDLFPSLMKEAIQAMNYLDCNALALIKDFKDIPETIRGTSDALLDIAKKVKAKRGKELLLAIGNADLSQRYGYKLTIDDAWGLGEAIERLRQTTKFAKKNSEKARSGCRRTIPYGGNRVAKVLYNYEARIAPPTVAIEKLMQFLYEWDLYPSLGNMWDFVPYSFVVDWFVNIGDMAEDIDIELQKKQYHLLSVIKSRKVVRQGSASQLLRTSAGWSGSVKITEYNRWIEHQFDHLPISLEFHPEDCLGHLVEGTELFLQRIL